MNLTKRARDPPQRCESKAIPTTAINSPKEDKVLYPAPVSAPTCPYGAVAMSIIGRLPDTARLISDPHPLASDPENMGEPLQCDVCGITKCASRMAVLVDSENMPRSGGPLYVEACEHCIDRVCEKLADAGIGVDEDYDDDDEN